MQDTQQNKRKQIRLVILTERAEKKGKNMYENCDLCRKLHDDGALFVQDGKTRYICFDCDDKLQELKEVDSIAYEREIKKLFTRKGD